MLKNLGETEDGTAWCLKALHPSDPLSEVKGIPDECCQPTSFLNFQTVSTLTTAQASGTWSAEMQLFPNPVNFLSGVYTDSVTSTQHYFQHMNSQLTGLRSYDKYASFSTDNVAWRLAYAGVTIVQDGPSLADQGTIVACQKSLYPIDFNASSLNPTAGVVSSAVHLQAFTYDSMPVFETTQAMPNSYMAQSKEGVYIPLRLTNDRSWFSAKDGRLQAVYKFSPTYANPGFMDVAQTAGPGVWPYWDGVPGYLLGGSPYTHGGALQPAMCSTNVADICFKNVSYQSSFTFFYRYGFEVQLLPNSAFSPFLALSPRLDLEALHNYFRISRELKDAYPASYNDFGTMMSQLLEAVGGLSKTLSLVNPLFGSVAQGAGAVGRMMRKGRKPPQPARNQVQSQISASDVEQGRVAIKTNRPQKVKRKQQQPRRQKPRTLFSGPRGRGVAKLF